MLQTLGLRTLPNQTFIGKAGFKFLGVLCHPTGPLVSESALSRRDTKLTLLDESSAFKKRIRQSLAIGIGWALLAGSTHTFAASNQNVVQALDGSEHYACIDDLWHVNFTNVRSQNRDACYYDTIYGGSDPALGLAYEGASVVSQFVPLTLITNHALNKSGTFVFQDSEQYYWCVSLSYIPSISIRYTNIAALPNDPAAINQDNCFQAFIPTNSNPNISSNSVMTASENQTSVGTVTAEDVDGDTISYSIFGGSDASAFSMNSSSGVLTFNTAPDYETQNSYSVEVTADDGNGATDTQNLTLNVDDVNEAPSVSGESISGSPLVGQELTASGTFSDPDAGDTASNGALSFQWYKASNSACDSKRRLNGATDSTYTVPKGVINKYLCVTITPIDDEGLSGTPVTVTTSTSVPKIDQAITFNDPGHKTYGEASFALGATADSGLTVSTSASPTSVCTITGDNLTIVSPGTCTVTASQTGNAKYAAAANVTHTFNIAKKAITATADDKTRVYGAENPTATFTYSGGALGIDTPPTATFPSLSTNVGTHEISCSGGSDENYEITSCEAGTLTITQKAISVTADDKTKVYGEANPVLTVSYSGLVNGDTELSSPPTLATTAESTTGTGTIAITCTGGSDPNYSLSGECTAGTLTLTKKTITATADAKSRAYHTPNPALTVTYDGLVNGETAMSTPPTLATTAETTSAIGEYEITCHINTDANYNLTSCTDSVLTITKADSTTTIDSDNADPSITGQSITVDVSVTSSISATPTGTVMIDDGYSNTCEMTLNGGTGSCELTPADRHTTLTATYSGDSLFNGSSDTEEHISLVADIPLGTFTVPANAITIITIPVEDSQTPISSPDGSSLDATETITIRVILK